MAPDLFGGSPGRPITARAVPDGPDEPGHDGERTGP
jgi:hypothetical protein